MSPKKTNWIYLINSNWIFAHKLYIITLRDFCFVYNVNLLGFWDFLWRDPRLTDINVAKNGHIHPIVVISFLHSTIYLLLIAVMRCEITHNPLLYS